MDGAEQEDVALDVSKRFVRVNGRRGNGFIEFDFAIGEPEIFVEMILSEQAFKEFCEQNKVVMLPSENPDAPPHSDWDWRLGDATRL